jgi:hypothetical protein
MPATDPQIPAPDLTAARSQAFTEATTETLKSAHRNLLSISEDCLKNIGVLDENVGATCRSVSHWQKQKKKTGDTDAFYALLSDTFQVAIMCDIGRNSSYYEFDSFSDWLSTKKESSMIIGDTATTFDWVRTHTQTPTIALLDELFGSYTEPPQAPRETNTGDPNNPSSPSSSSQDSPTTSEDTDPSSPEESTDETPSSQQTLGSF